MEDVWQHLVIMRGDSEIKASTEHAEPRDEERETRFE